MPAYGRKQLLSFMLTKYSKYGAINAKQVEAGKNGTQLNLKYFTAINLNY